MPRLTYLFAILLCFGLYGQTIDSNSITVLVSRTATLPADQVQFQITVSSSADAELATITNALRAAGVPTTIVFAGLTNTQSYGGVLSGVIMPITQEILPTLNWQFTITVPYAKLHEQLAALQKSAQSLRKDTKFGMTFGLSGTTVSDAAIDEARRKLLPDLMADARKRATALADAAGVTAGSVLGLTEGAGVIPSVIGNISTYVTGNASPTYAVPYSLNVKFQLLRYN